MVVARVKGAQQRRVVKDLEIINKPSLVSDGMTMPAALTSP